VPGAYLVLDHDFYIQTRPQVYCKEYPGLVGLESLRSEADPISDDGKILEFEVDAEKRMHRDSELIRRSVKLPADRGREMSTSDENYWDSKEPVSESVDRHATRSRTRPAEEPERGEPVAMEAEADRDTAVVLAAVEAFLALQKFQLPTVPKSMEEALSRPDAEHRRIGRDKELKGISDRKTWENLSANTKVRKRPITSQWAFRVSWEPDGSVKYRCRIVARGFSQVPGADYDQTYAPTLQMKTALVMLGIIAHKDWEAEMTDVGNAYLESVIDKTLYMLLPKDLWVDGIPVVVRLKKAIYGLKQTGELWVKLLAGYLSEIGFKRSMSDMCKFIGKEADGSRLFILVNVDDLILVGRSKKAIDGVKLQLEQRFTMKHQG
jgi:hypothetical protein